MNWINKWILRSVPVLAPFPTAYVIFERLQSVLSWDWRVALAAAVVIEAIGFRSVGLAVEMYQFNRTCSAVEARLKAPIWQAVVSVVLYATAVIGLTILIEILPTLSLWSPVAFVVMGLTGGWLAALTSDQDARAQERADGRAKAQAAREQANLARKADKARKQDPQIAQVAPASDKQDDKLHPQGRKQESKQPMQDESLLAYWRDNPQASDQQVADKFGKSRQAVQQRREKLIKQGAIAMSNGSVEIVGVPVTLNAERTA